MRTSTYTIGRSRVILNRKPPRSSSSCLPWGQAPGSQLSEANLPGGFLETRSFLPFSAAEAGLRLQNPSSDARYAVHGITRINAAAPGNTETPMFVCGGPDMAELTRPAGRCGQPEEVAEMMCGRAAFVTESIDPIDAGFYYDGFSGYNEGFCLD
ncbi:hypothetical protein LY76DRAFT_636595 [Colletotrichum caudatum]|nr:hypothetical protein LY76DRAFT_636595 [Colletotrichum caudatum]